MNDSILWDEPSIAAPSDPIVRCGSADHSVFRGELAPVEKTLSHDIQALVMATPLFDDGAAVARRYLPSDPTGVEA